MAKKVQPKKTPTEEAQAAMRAQYTKLRDAAQSTLTQQQQRLETMNKETQDLSEQVSALHDRIQQADTLHCMLLDTANGRISVEIAGRYFEGDAHGPNAARRHHCRRRDGVHYGQRRSH